MAHRRSKFTPGPWRAVLTSIRGAKVWQVRNGHRDPVAIVYTTEADARVMAAAPELHACMKRAVSVITRHAPNAPELESMRALLARIEGK